MKKWTPIHILTLFSLCLALGVLIFTQFSFRTDDVRFERDKPSILQSGWYQIEDGVRNAIPSLPATLTPDDNGYIVLEATLPDHLPGGATLFITTIYQNLDVFIDNDCIYQLGENDTLPFGHSFGYAWNLVHLSSEAAEKKLTLRFFSPLGKKPVRTPQILLGSKSSILFHLVERNIGAILFCIFLFFICIFLVFLFILCLFRHLKYYAIFSFALFSILTFIWTITDTGLSQFFYGNRVISNLISFFSFMLLPVPLLQFAKTSVSQKHHRILDRLSLLLLVNFIVCILLQITNTLDLVMSILSAHLLIMISAGYLIYVLCYEWMHSHDANARILGIGVCCFGLFGIFELIHFYFFFNTDNGQFFRIGFLLFFIAFIIQILRKVTNLMRADIERTTYRELAYTDSLTNLPNRRAFEEHLNSLRASNSIRSLCFIMLDINGLKHMNDTHGHTAGDHLIITAAACIDTAFSPYGHAYRIGGDEFCVILEDIASDTVSEAQKAFHVQLQAQSVPLSLSIGTASAFNADIASQVDALLQCADAQMYQNKPYSR